RGHESVGVAAGENDLEFGRGERRRQALANQRMVFENRDVDRSAHAGTARLLAPQASRLRLGSNARRRRMRAAPLLAACAVLWGCGDLCSRSDDLAKRLNAKAASCSSLTIDGKVESCPSKLKSCSPDDQAKLNRWFD